MIDGSNGTWSLCRSVCTCCCERYVFFVLEAVGMSAAALSCSAAEPLVPGIDSPLHRNNGNWEQAKKSDQKCDCGGSSCLYAQTMTATVERSSAGSREKAGTNWAGATVLKAWRSPSVLSVCWPGPFEE